LTKLLTLLKATTIKKFSSGRDFVLDLAPTAA